MMKKTLLSLFFAGFALISPRVEATTYVFSDCGTGAVGGCVVGSDVAAGTSVATAFQTSSKFKTIFQNAAAGDHIQFCQGGAWNAFATGNMKNTNSSSTSPITIETVSCASIYGGAGAGIKPKLNGTGNGGSAVLSFNQASPSAPTAGWIIKDIEIIGDGSTTANGLFFAGNESYITIDNVKITLTATAIQIQGGVNSSSGTGTGIGAHYIIRNSTISQNYNAGILASSPDILIENNVMTKNGGGSFLYHDIYLAELDNTFPVPQTISTLVGNGATVIMTTSAPHGLASGTHFIVTVSGASTNFNVSGVVGTVTGASTFTYPATGVGTAGAVGTYSTQSGIPVSQAVIRHNNLSEGDSGAAGSCQMAHIVIHGTWSNVLVESNVISESVVPSFDFCIGIEIDSGGYGIPDDFEGFRGVIVRDNTLLNLAYGITLDITIQGLIENNYAVCGRPGDAGCILMRGKGGSTIPVNALSPDKITIRHNTVYLSNPDGSSIGIGLNGNVGDPLTGAGHNLYGNAVILGSGGAGGATTNTQCFNTDNVTTGKFTTRDYNQCYYLGSNVPKWSGTSSLATIQGTGADTHSALTNTANITSGQPFLLVPATTPAIGASSSLINSGHPTLGPKTGWHGSVRVGPPYDGGAFEFGATLGVVPDSQVRLGTP